MVEVREYASRRNGVRYLRQEDVVRVFPLVTDFRSRPEKAMVTEDVKFTDDVAEIDATGRAV